MLIKILLHTITLIIIAALTSVLLTKSITNLILYAEIYSFLLLPSFVFIGLIKGTSSTMLLILMVVLVAASELIITATANKLASK